MARVSPRLISMETGSKVTFPTPLLLSVLLYFAFRAIYGSRIQAETRVPAPSADDNMMKRKLVEKAEE